MESRIRTLGWNVLARLTKGAFSKRAFGISKLAGAAALLVATSGPVSAAALDDRGIFTGKQVNFGGTR